MSRRWSRRPRRPLGLLVAGAGLAVVAYNLWALCCGRCTLQSLARPGHAGWILLALSAAAAGTLGVLRFRNRRRPSSADCSVCRRPLQGDWLFCPDCGEGLGRGR